MSKTPKERAALILQILEEMGKAYSMEVLDPKRAAEAYGSSRANVFFPMAFDRIKHELDTIITQS